MKHDVLESMQFYLARYLAPRMLQERDAFQKAHAAEHDRRAALQAELAALKAKAPAVETVNDKLMAVVEAARPFADQRLFIYGYEAEMDALIQALAALTTPPNEKENGK